MGSGIGTEKTPVERRARIGKTVGFLHFASPLLVFAHHKGASLDSVVAISFLIVSCTLVMDNGYLWTAIWGGSRHAISIVFRCRLSIQGLKH